MAAARALELDDTLGSAHYVLATARAWYSADWAGAEQQFQRALTLDPDNPMGRNWYGGYLSLRGRHDEAIAEHGEAIRQLARNYGLTLDPARCYPYRRG